MKRRMPRERKSAKNKAIHNPEDGSEPPVKATKKRRGSAAAANSMRAGSGPNQNGDPMLLPPQPVGSYGDTLYASNPFDDMPSMSPMGQHGMPQNMGPMPPGGPGHHGPPPPHMMNQMMPGNGMIPHGMVMGPGGPRHHHGPPLSQQQHQQHGPGPGGPGGPPPQMQQKPPPQMMGPQMMGGPPPPSQQQQHPPPPQSSLPPNGPPPPNSMMPGRTYPSEQSMVFNPANPNAPPIYPCGICHKEVHDNDQGILCESGCNFWFHRACTGISERAFFLLHQEVYAEWVCDNCLRSKNIPLIKFKP